MWKSCQHMRKREIFSYTEHIRKCVEWKVNTEILYISTLLCDTSLCEVCLEIWRLVCCVSAWSDNRNPLLWALKGFWDQAGLRMVLCSWQTGDRWKTSGSLRERDVWLRWCDILHLQKKKTSVTLSKTALDAQVINVIFSM